MCSATVFVHRLNLQSRGLRQTQSPSWVTPVPMGVCASRWASTRCACGQNGRAVFRGVVILAEGVPSRGPAPVCVSSCRRTPGLRPSVGRGCGQVWAGTCLRGRGWAGRVGGSAGSVSGCAHLHSLPSGCVPPFRPFSLLVGVEFKSLFLRAQAAAPVLGLLAVGDFYLGPSLRRFYCDVELPALSQSPESHGPAESPVESHGRASELLTRRDSVFTLATSCAGDTLRTRTRRAGLFQVGDPLFLPWRRVRRRGSWWERRVRRLRGRCFGMACGSLSCPRVPRELLVPPSHVHLPRVACVPEAGDAWLSRVETQLTSSVYQGNTLPHQGTCGPVSGRPVPEPVGRRACAGSSVA